MMNRRVHIVGGGFSGLTAAYYLRQQGFTVVVYEKQSECGGLIQTKQTEHGLVESAANAILNSDRLEMLTRDLGIELVPSQRSAARRYILRGLPRRWPLSIRESLELFARAIWSTLSGKFRPNPELWESVSSWGERVLGKAAVKNLLAPALAGIYAGDPKALDANLILGPIFTRDREQSRLRNGRSFRRGSVAPRMGMGALISALTRKLQAMDVEIRTESEFCWQHRKPDEVVVLACGLTGTEQLLRNLAPDIADRLQDLESLSLVTLTLFFRKTISDIRGFGCLFAPEEKRNFLGVLFNSDIFPNRSAKLRSETWIGGGALHPDLVHEAESTLLAKIREDRIAIGQSGGEPVAVYLQRWPQALPHFTQDLRRFLEGDARKQLAARGIFLHGNFCGRIGLSSILERSELLSQELAKGA